MDIFSLPRLPRPKLPTGRSGWKSDAVFPSSFGKTAAALVVAFLFGEFVMAQQTFDNPKQQLAGLSLLLSISGIAFGFLIGMIGTFTGSNTTRAAFFAFAAIEIMAIVCGAFTWSHPMGKGGAITAASLLALSVLLVA